MANYRFKIFLLIVALILVISINLLIVIKPATFEISTSLKQSQLITQFQVATTSNQQGITPSIATSSITAYLPSFTFIPKDNRFITLSWQNLPPETAKLLVFRSLIKSKLWKLWKTITIETAETKQGSLDINIDGDPLKFSYYVQVLNKDNRTLWASPIIELQPKDGKTTLTQPTNKDSQSKITTQQPDNQSPTTPSYYTTNNQQLQTNQLQQSAIDSSQVAYFTPEGKISGPISLIPESFWVKYVNNAIEIGWQNLPPPTDMIIIYRSKNKTGPWDELLRQRNPDTTGPKFIRLVDFAVGIPYYYKMEAYSQSQSIAVYTPILLSP